MTLAISLKHGSILPAFCFNEFLNLSAEVGVGGNFFPAFTHCPLQFHKRLNIGFYSDMTVIYLFERCASCTCNVFNFTLNFFFLTSDASGSCWHLIFKWKWLSWMKAVSYQPFRHRWHLSCFQGIGVVFCINEAVMDKIDWTFTFALYFFEVWHCHLENSRKIYTNSNFSRIN